MYFYEFRPGVAWMKCRICGYVCDDGPICVCGSISAICPKCRSVGLELLSMDKSIYCGCCGNRIDKDKASSTILGFSGFSENPKFGKSMFFAS